MTGFVTWLLKQSPIVQGLMVVGVLALLFGVSSQISSCRYDKERAKYEAEKQAWASERGKLIGAAEEKERRVAELEPQVQAFKAAAEAGKKVDEGLAEKIEAVAKESADAEANAEIPVDCRIRAERICQLFRRSDARFDCRPLFAECERPK